MCTCVYVCVRASVRVNIHLNVFVKDPVRAINKINLLCIYNMFLLSVCKI